MRFLVPLGLLVAALVVGPLVAHLLRRRRPEERPFPAARLVPTAPPVARRRAHLEDRWLLLIRALAVLLLALLAASPLVRCSSLSLDRKGGASIALAIVIDDSASMQAPLPSSARHGGATTRFDLAIVSAREIASSLRSGDSTTIVLAGSPARVALAPTSDAAVVRAAIDKIASDHGSDRATDLDGAITLASSALGELPQPDRRIALLSDLADGNSGAPPLAAPENKGIRVDAPLEALRAPPDVGTADCAILAATPEGDAVRVKAACSLPTGVGKRAIEIVTADAAHTKVGSLALPPSPPAAPATFELLVPIDKSKVSSLAPTEGKPTLLARVTGEPEALTHDDVAPVLGAATAPAVGVVVGEGGALDEIVATGGAPVVERALVALQSGVPIRPLPSVPDRETDLASFAGLAVDDPAGLGPEQRAAVSAWVERGGVLFVALGPRSATPPLGSSLEPFVLRSTRWEKVTGPLGVDPKKAGPLGEGVDPPADLAPKGRAILDREDEARFSVRSAFGSGAPLILSRAVGQGEVWLSTLPFAPDQSDLPVRPAFLALLDAFVARARDRGAGARLAVGESWSVGAEGSLVVVPIDNEGKKGAPLEIERGIERHGDATSEGQRARPAKIGAYLVTIAAHGAAPRTEVRAVAPNAAETDLRPRALAPTVAAGAGSGLARTHTELGSTLAILVVGLVAIELAARAFRLFVAARDDAGAEDAEGRPSQI
ncbi:MAG: vWA domain-containing protein [Polyangiales bacterium]